MTATSETALPHRRYPCAECPFRRDTKPGMFPACRYDALRDTAGSPGREAPIGAPVFACHKSPEGREEACAGWLAVTGYDHLGVRIAVIRGDLPATALSPGDGWPDLYGSYDEMAEVMADPTLLPLVDFTDGWGYREERADYSD